MSFFFVVVVVVVAVVVVLVDIDDDVDMVVVLISNLMWNVIYLPPKSVKGCREIANAILFSLPHWF